MISRSDNEIEAEQGMGPQEHDGEAEGRVETGDGMLRWHTLCPRCSPTLHNVNGQVKMLTLFTLLNVRKLLHPSVVLLVRSTGLQHELHCSNTHKRFSLEEEELRRTFIFYQHGDAQPCSL